MVYFPFLVLHVFCVSFSRSNLNLFFCLHIKQQVLVLVCVLNVSAIKIQLVYKCISCLLLDCD